MQIPCSSPARLAGGTALATFALIAAAPMASAHVRVTPESAKPGSYATLTFKVPNESPTARTTKLVVTLPATTPFGDVSYQPVPGWKAEVTTRKLPKPVTTEHGKITEAPTTITWTATGEGIAPGQFQTFPISAGPVPDTGSLQLDARQSYSDGTVVDWNEKQSGSSEPEHPAPVLFVRDTAPTDDASTASPANAAVRPSGSTTSSDSTGRWLGAGGLALGAIALVTAAWAATRRR